MKKLLTSLILTLVSGLCSAETYKTKFSPFTGKLDYVTVVTSETLPSGSTQYIQNTSTLQSGSTFYTSSGTVSGQLRVGTLQGAALSACGDATHALSWTGGSFGCQEITVAPGTGDNLGAGTGSYGVATTTGGFTGAGGVSVTYGISAGSVTASNFINSNSEYRLDGNTALTNAGTQSIIVGYGASSDLTNSGSSNSCLGYAACGAITNGANNTVLGHRAGLVAASFDHNTCVGHSACESMTDGQTNTILGSNAGFACTDCGQNVIIGYTAGAGVTSGSANVLIGDGAGDSVTLGNYNTLIGGGTGNDMTTGTKNVCIGGYDNSTNGCSGLITGSSNTAVGNGAGGASGQDSTNRGGVFFGFGAQTSGSNPLINAGAIGYQATVSSSNTLRLGGSLTNAMRVDMSSFTASSGTVAGQFRTGTLEGAALATCGDGTHGLGWSGGSFTCQEITGTGVGSGIVSPGTFTWTNTFGISLSTIVASSNTSVANGTAVFTDNISTVHQLYTRAGAGVGIGALSTLGSNSLEAVGTIASGVSLQAPAYLGGYYLMQTTLRPSLSMNASGSNYGQIMNRDASSWSLGYGTSLTALGTDVLRWGSAPYVNILSSVTITGAKGLTLTYGVSAATVSVTDDAYAAGWNGSTEVPTKNAVYDQIEAEPAATRTLTNKTLDAEGTGNVITIPFVTTQKAAVCQNTTASLSFSTTTGASPTPTCVTGTNTQFGVAKFFEVATSTVTVQDHFTLPSDWTGNIDFSLKWRTTATSGDVFWQLSTICVADAETSDPAFNTASTVADTAKGTTLQQNDASITSVTVTGCAAGEELYWKLGRCTDHASDTLAAAADLISISWKIRRQI